MQSPNANCAFALLVSSFQQHQRTDGFPAIACWAAAGRLLASNRDVSENRMKTQGEIEAAICEGITRVEQDHMGQAQETSTLT
jgi:hypothetical protein